MAVPIATRLRSALVALFVVAFGCASTGTAWAQAPGLRLQRTLTPLPKSAQDAAPIFVDGDRIEAEGDDEMRVFGRAHLRKADLSLTADQLYYRPELDEVEARGSVRFLSPSGEITGPRLRFRIDDQIGVFENPQFKLAPVRGSGVSRRVIETRGEAQAIRFEGEDRYRISDGSFTSCKPGNDDWYIRAREIDLDFGADDGEARGARLTFKGFTTPPLPWVTFSLDNQRKSGFLPPTFGVQGKVGPELTLPFYWNIAPNYDATFAPRFMTRRGVQLLAEGRYLEPWYSGVARYEVIPHDRQTGTSRNAITLQHAYNWQGRYVGNINLNKVSDDNYFRELSSRISIATQVYLPREGALTYNFAPGWAVTTRLQRFQTLQDPLNPITRPYERLPQVLLNGVSSNARGFDTAAIGEFVAFEHPTLPLGRRLTFYPSVAWPVIRPGYFLTPKVGLHVTQYALSRTDSATDPLVQGATDRSPSRVLPIASVDTGLVFERTVNWAGRSMINTLEPRMYYLYVPYRDQSGIPLFDTAAADFNYAQIFSENTFSGGDRISNANQVTFALTSRLITTDSGQEVLRGLIGQRYYFTSQRVALSSAVTPNADKSSSLLVGLAGRVAPRVTLEATAQLAAADQSPERFNVGVRYQPELGKILNLGYRYTNAALNPNPSTGDCQSKSVNWTSPDSGRSAATGIWSAGSTIRSSRASRSRPWRGSNIMAGAG